MLHAPNNKQGQRVGTLPKKIDSPINQQQRGSLYDKMINGVVTFISFSNSNDVAVVMTSLLLIVIL
jgi:hypothetical protein